MWAEVTALFSHQHSALI